MKIETNNLKNRCSKVMFCDGIVVDFDANGVAEIDDSQAKKILAEYKGMVFEAGKMPVVKNVKNTEKTSESINEDSTLKAALDLEKQKVIRLEADLKVQEQSCNSWKKQYEESSKAENEAIKKAKEDASSVDIKPLKAKIEKLKADNNALSLKYNLIQKSVKELKDAATQLGATPEEIKNLEKDKIVDLIVEKSNAKN